MKKSNQTFGLSFDKKSVAELNSNEMLKVQGGTSPLYYYQAASQMTPAIITSGLIGEENNAN